MCKQNKALAIAFVLLSLFSTALFAKAPQTSGSAKAKYAKNLIKVKLSPQAITRSNLPTALYAETNTFGINELDQLLSVKGGTTIIRAHRKLKDQAWADKTGWDNWFLIRLDGRSSVEEAITSFRQNRYIEEAGPEYYAYSTAVPNDTHYSKQWGHNNTAQLPGYTSYGHTGAGVGTVGFDSDAQLAWDLPQGYGSSSIIIAIIDSGVDTAHEDLRLVSGYDYGDNDSNPMDDAPDAGHGTSCAGIAAAKANNGIGVAGIAGGCSVMPLKVANSNGELSFTFINNAITHAADNGAHIISMSFGAEDMVQGDSPSTDAALEYAYSNNVTIFAATANENASVMNYPSNHNKVISVGAASPSGERKSPSSSDGEDWWGSNYGVDTQDARDAVDIMGPTILPTTDISGSAGYASGNYSMYLFNGTSCATPYVAGAAALILSFRPTLTPAELRTVMTSTATDMTFDGGVGWDRYTGYGMVNVYNAIMSLNPDLPTVAITAPTAGSTHALGSTITVNATASDSDGYVTQVAFYLNDVWQFTDSTSPYSWAWNTSSASAGSHTLKAIATDDDSNTAESSVSITLLPPADEGFESGNFSAYPWLNTSATPWTVQSAEKYCGTYAAKSGAIGNYGVTNLSLTQTVSAAGTISFYYKVSSESGYDKFSFLIDGVQQVEGSGTVPWTLASYPVSAGVRTFTWRYSKDSSSSSGTDCTWIDHIVLPPLGEYFAPPLSLFGIPSDNIITLNWQSPSVDALSYNVFRDGLPLSSAASPTYQDTNVSNGTSYSYYVTAVYPGGESEPSNSINVTAGIALEATLGTGTTSTGTSAASPINVFYKSSHGQSVYTAAELSAAGIVGPIHITQLGFDVAGVPLYNLPNFVVRMKHSTAANVASWQTGLSTVYSNISHAPATGWDLLTLDTPFLWNGVDNIVVDTAFDLVSSYNGSGQVKYTTVTNGYRHIRSDTSNQTNVFSGGSTSTTRPNLKLIFAPLAADPEFSVNPTSNDFGSILAGTSAQQSFTISNSGQGSLGITQVELQNADTCFSLSDTNGYPEYLATGENITVSVSFSPTEEGTFSATLLITDDLGSKTAHEVSITGSAYAPLAAPFVDGFETVTTDWVIVNGTQTNGWYIGEATANTGTKSIYISSDGGATHSYELGDTSISHFYADIAFPETSQDFYLRFNWMANGEGGYSDYDYLQVYLVDTTVSPVAGTLLSSGSLSASPLMLETTWQNANIALPEALSGSTKRLVFTWKNDFSGGEQAPAAIDNIRIVEEQSQDLSLIIAGESQIDLPGVSDGVNTIHASLIIDGVTGAQVGYAVAYASAVSPFSNAGLDITLTADGFVNAYLVIDHNLGFIPSTIAYSFGGGWNVVFATLDWTTATVDFVVNTGKQKAANLTIVFSDSSEDTLPVTLSSFTAVYVNGGAVKLNWIAATETGVMGYYVLRAENEELGSALAVSALIEAANSSQAHSYEYKDSEALSNNTYYYWLMITDFNGVEGFFGPLTVFTDSNQEEPTPIVPIVTQNLGNFPNPFNPNTNIRYSLAEAAPVKISIFNSRGQRVRLFNNEHASPGYYSLAFDGKDERGQELSSGVYFYRFEAGKVRSTHRMMLLK